LEQSSARKTDGLAVISQIAFAVMFFFSWTFRTGWVLRRSTSDAFGTLEYPIFEGPTKEDIGGMGADGAEQQTAAATTDLNERHKDGRGSKRNQTAGQTIST
jgi:hypothetical protein